MAGHATPRSILLPQNLSQSQLHDTGRNCHTQEKQTQRESKLIQAIFALLVLVIIGLSVLVTLQSYPYYRLLIIKSLTK